jgi:hypothetical protein
MSRGIGTITKQNSKIKTTEKSKKLEQNPPFIPLYERGKIPPHSDILHCVQDAKRLLIP